MLCRQFELRVELSALLRKSDEKKEFHTLGKCFSRGLIWRHRGRIRMPQQLASTDGSPPPALHCADQPLWKSTRGMKKVMPPALDDHTST